jgi:hypothetical protein
MLDRWKYIQLNLVILRLEDQIIPSVIHYLFIVSNASGHPTCLDDFHANVKVVFMCPNMT